MVPYRRRPKLHSENTMVPYHLSLMFTLRTWLWDYRKIATHVFSKFSQCDQLIQQIRMYLRYDVQIHMYIHTYIHTYIQTPLAFNTLMWGLLRLAPNTDTDFPVHILHTKVKTYHFWRQSRQSCLQCLWVTGQEDNCKKGLHSDANTATTKSKRTN